MWTGESELVRIEVTARDIEDGRRNNCWKCPVALAILRTPGVTVAEVATHTMFDGTKQPLWAHVKKD